MKKENLTRRTFVKNTSAGAIGVALTAGGISSFFACSGQDAGQLALLGGKPVRPENSPLGVKWPIFDDSDIGMIVDSYKNKHWSEHSFREEELQRINSGVCLNILAITYTRYSRNVKTCSFCNILQNHGL